MSSNSFAFNDGGDTSEPSRRAPRDPSLPPISTLFPGGSHPPPPPAYPSYAAQSNPFPTQPWPPYGYGYMPGEQAPPPVYRAPAPLSVSEAPHDVHPIAGRPPPFTQDPSSSYAPSQRVPRASPAPLPPPPKSRPRPRPHPPPAKPPSPPPDLPPAAPSDDEFPEDPGSAAPLPSAKALGKRPAPPLVTTRPAKRARKSATAAPASQLPNAPAISSGRGLTYRDEELNAVMDIVEVLRPIGSWTPVAIEYEKVCRRNNWPIRTEKSVKGMWDKLLKAANGVKPTGKGVKKETYIRAQEIDELINERASTVSFAVHDREAGVPVTDEVISMSDEDEDETITASAPAGPSTRRPASPTHDNKPAITVARNYKLTHTVEAKPRVTRANVAAREALNDIKGAFSPQVMYERDERRMAQHGELMQVSALQAQLADERRVNDSLREKVDLERRRADAAEMKLEMVQLMRTEQHGRIFVVLPVACPITHWAFDTTTSGVTVPQVEGLSRYPC
ncbi:hypothetical protein EV715DRAFT_266814 [Schizophyllum commune]